MKDNAVKLYFNHRPLIIFLLNSEGRSVCVGEVVSGNQWCMLRIIGMKYWLTQKDTRKIRNKYSARKRLRGVSFNGTSSRHGPKISIISYVPHKRNNGSYWSFHGFTKVTIHLLDIGWDLPSYQFRTSPSPDTRCPEYIKGITFIGETFY